MIRIQGRLEEPMGRNAAGLRMRRLGPGLGGIRSFSLYLYPLKLPFTC